MEWINKQIYEKSRPKQIPAVEYVDYKTRILLPQSSQFIVDFLSLN